jgi:hypothetical protein
MKGAVAYARTGGERTFDALEEVLLKTQDEQSD